MVVVIGKNNGIVILQVGIYRESVLCLAVDVGNTCTKFCMFAGDEALWLEKIDTSGVSMDSVLEMFSEVELEDEDVFIASVVTSVNPTLQQAFTELGAASVTMINATDNILPHTLATIETTGVDRLPYCILCQGPLS